MEIVRHLALGALAALVVATALAADAPAKSPLEEKVDQLVRESLPVCSDMKVTREKLNQSLPHNLSATLVNVDSESYACKGQYAAIVSAEGGFYVGHPWFLSGREGTLEEKIKSFTWDAMQDHVSPVIDRTRTRDGLFKVTMAQTTARGRVPLEGEVDPAGTVFFLGHFQPLTADIRAARQKVFEPFYATAPSKGAVKPQVTVVEFSDFECPSCKHASGYLDPIMAKHGDKVRYVRYDLPLVSFHPWAFSAAVAGRAIYRQKPELFWEYKKAVYENQEKLNAFTIEDFTRGFAADHELNMTKYDADVASDEIKNEILKGVGAAFSNSIRSTPTYIVNGTIVGAGDDGQELAKYVANLVK